jgi:hypothetical protein
MKRTFYSIFLLFGCSAFLYSCYEVKNETAQLSVSLTDAPGDYNAVNVHVTGVEVHTDGNGWQQLPVASGWYDLLTLRNNVDTVLVQPQSLPAGRITQVRLILGDSNTVMVDSVLYPLDMSSQDETGLKCVLNDVLQPNTSYRLLLDFDAENSVMANGSGGYKLKPVVKATFQ